MKSKYKLLVIGPENRHIENFVNRLVGETSQIDVISSGRIDVPDGVKVFYTDFSLRRIFNLYRTTRFIYKTIRACDPDIIHVHQINTVAFYAVLANLFAGKPIVLTAWGSDILLEPQRSVIMRSLVRFCLRNADGLTSDSAFMAEKMKQLLPKKMVDVKVFNFGVKETHLSLVKEKLIYSNRLHKPLYRIDCIIRAFHGFIKSGKSEGWRLVVAATGTETENLKKLASDLGIGDKITFAGFLDNDKNAEYYSKAMVFVTVPESDATSISLLEAMYYQCVPFVSDLPANREWVMDGVNGFVVKDVNSNFLDDLGSIDLQSTGEMNRSIILERATAAVATRNFSGLHRRILGIE